MNQHEIMGHFENILEDTKIGILASINKNGRPKMHWVVPFIVKGRINAIFSVASHESLKVADIETHPDVEWMVQSRDISTIIKMRGRINVVDNPSLKGEILENISREMSHFWDMSQLQKDFIILETVIEKATYYKPKLHKRETVMFS